MYNGGSDDLQRSKMLMSDFPSFAFSFHAFVVGLIYLPAILTSLISMLPPLLVVFIGSQSMSATSALSSWGHLKAIVLKSTMFLDRLVYLHDNVEGDLWEYDPLPFLAKNHVQVASRLLASLRTGIEWKKIDFAIGKVVEVGGD